MVEFVQVSSVGLINMLDESYSLNGELVITMCWLREESDHSCAYPRTRQRKKIISISSGVGFGCCPQKLCYSNDSKKYDRVPRKMTCVRTKKKQAHIMYCTSSVLCFTCCSRPLCQKMRSRKVWTKLHVGAADAF